MRTIIRDLPTLLAHLPEWQGKKFAFDIESSGLSFRRDRLLGLALYFENGQAYYVVLEHTMPNGDGTACLQTFIDRKMLGYLASALFAQSDVVMVGHNAKFDMHFLHKNRVFVQGRLFDTLLAAQLLDENRKNGLKELAESMGFGYDKYSKLGVYSGYKKDEILGVPLEDAAEYAMNDVQATWTLYKRFAQELANERMERIFHEIWMPLLPVLQEMEARGIALNLDKVREIRAEYVEKIERLEKRIMQYGVEQILAHYSLDDIDKMPIYYRDNKVTEEDMERSYRRDDGVLVFERDGVEYPIITYEMIGKTKAYRPRYISFNTGSTDQMRELIYEWSGVNLDTDVPLERTKTGELSVDKQNIETMLFYDDDAPEFLQDVLDWRKASKFVSTYLDRFLADADPNDFNSITTNFNQAVGETGKGGTVTGRLSSNNPNLMNIPSRGVVGEQARSMFVARTGHKLIIADYSQMELRLLAHYSQDPVLLQAFAEKRDMHIVTATAPARMSYEELKALYDADDKWAKEMRSIGKTMNFALNYGMGPRKFRRFLLTMNKYEVTEQQAAEWIKNYNETYEATTEWKKNTAEEVGRYGYVTTIYGRRRRLPLAKSPVARIRERAKRQGVNAKIQGGCGDIICRVMIPLQAYLRSIGGSLLLQVHDELVMEVPEKYAEIAKPVVEHIMVDFVNPYLNVAMEATASIGDNWGAK